MTSYALQVTIDETLSRQGCGDNLVIARKVSGVMNTVCTGFSFQRRGDFQTFSLHGLKSTRLPCCTSYQRPIHTSRVGFQVWLRRSSTNKSIYIERATEDVHINMGEVTTFDQHSLSECREAAC